MALFNLLGKIRSASSIKIGAGLLEEVGKVIGMPRVGCAHDISLPIGPIDEEGTRLADTWGWPSSFAEDWEEQSLTLHTPFFRRCRYEHLPFSWVADEFGRHGGPRRERRIALMLKHADYKAAVIVPVHLPRGRVAAVSWWGDKQGADAEELVEREAPLLLLISHYFLHLLGDQALPPDISSSADSASVRELECLTFAGKGMSDAEIAHEMQISIHTARYHIYHVARRLGARNRTHAVALATQLGLIRLSHPGKH